MDKINARYVDEMDRLYDKLEGLEPGTEEYDKVQSLLLKAMDRKIELEKAKDAREVENNKLADAKKARKAQLLTFGIGLAIPPFVDLVCKRNLAKFIGRVEQMEYFTSSAGRSISDWFRFKK